MTLTADPATPEATPTASTVFVAPGRPGSVVEVKPRYENFIGGQWVAPVKGHYMANVSPVTGQPFCEVAKSSAEDVELALDAAHAAKDAWAETSLTERAAVLNAIADAIESNLEMLAVAESWENGKPVRETLAADLPLAADHFRYFAGATRSLEGRSTEIDKDTVAYHFHEPLGVVGQIIPFNFPHPHGSLEDRPGTGRRQLHRGQAGFSHSLVDLETGRGHLGCRATRGDQHRDRTRGRDR